MVHNLFFDRATAAANIIWVVKHYFMRLLAAVGLNVARKLEVTLT